MNTAEMVLDSMSRSIRRNMNKLIGKVSLVKPIIDRLQVNEIFEEILQDSPKREKVSNGLASEIMVMNRLAAPMPMYDVEEWVDEETCVGEVYDVAPGGMNDDRIANLFDDLHRKIPEIWNRLVSRAIAEYDIPFEVVYNDITSVYFEGTYTESDLVKLGYSRDQKPDKKQINIGINSNSVGIPLAYSILSGEKADKSTVIGNMEKVISTLKETPKASARPMVVGDRAMLDNKIIVAYHKRGDIDYLGTLKLTNAMKEAIAAIPDEKYKLIDTKRFHGLYEGYEMEFPFEHEGESVISKVLVVKSEQKFRTDQNQRRRIMEKFIQELDELKSKLNGKRYKKVESVEERIDKLQDEYSGSKYIKVTVFTNANGKVEIKYEADHEKIGKDSLLDGKYMIATNRREMTPEEMLRDYKVRDISEKNFSIIKGVLQVRPIFLQKDERIEALIFFSIIGLLVYCILKMLLIENEVDMSINNVLYEFKSLGVISMEFPDQSVMRAVSSMNWTQKDILDRLGFPYPSQYVNFAK